MIDLHKTIQQICEATRHWHLPMFVGLVSSIKVNPRINTQEKISDLGDVPGDNFLPKEILNSLVSRRGLKAALNS